MKEINLIPQELVVTERIVTELEELGTQAELCDESQLFENYLYLKRIERELKIIQKIYDRKIRDVSNEQTIDNDKFSLEFKSSKLFDKEKATKYIFEKDMQNEFMLQELDYKKVQNYIKSMANYDDFTKLGAKKITLKRKVNLK